MIGRESGQVGQTVQPVGPNVDQTGAPAYRIRRGNYVSFLIVPLVTLTGRIPAFVQIVYDDGTDDTISAPWPSTTAGSLTNTFAGPAKMDGWVVGMNPGVFTTTPPRGSVYIIVSIASSNDSGAYFYTTIAKGYQEGQNGVVQIGEMRPSDDFATWVFQGTVAEDGTGGTHICTLIVSPGAGNEMQLQSCFIVSGATATAQTGDAWIDDGSNILNRLLPGVTLGQSTQWSFPQVGTTTPTNAGVATLSPYTISGAMRLRLAVSTAAISVTQTFAVVCRIRGGLPTATLADSVGTPVLTTNTSAVF